MATFSNTVAPTPFGVFDSDTAFIAHADSMFTFVRRKLGDDILSVELTKKQVWACFEEATFEYSKIVNEYQAKSQLGNLMGESTGSLDANYGPTGLQGKFPRETLEFLMRKAEPYIAHAGLGGSWNNVSGSVQLASGKQDYDLAEDLKDSDGNKLWEQANGKLRIFEVYHYSPQAAYRFFDTTSAINYLNNEFAFESFTPETVFYVLPVYEDLLRAGQMDISNRVRRSNYSYTITGTKLRIYPRPSADQATQKLWLCVGFPMSGTSISTYTDPSINGVSGLHNVPFGTLTYKAINSTGHQWIRQYTLSLSKEVLGLVRSKFGSVPIPNGDLSLNGTDLLSQAQTEKSDLKTSLKEMLDSLTYDKILEVAAAEAESKNRLLKYVPVPMGKVITLG